MEKFSFRYLECNPDLPRVRKQVPDQPDVTRVTTLLSHPDSTDNLEQLVTNNGPVILTSSSCNSSITSSVSSSHHAMMSSSLHESTVTTSQSSSSGSDVSASSSSSSGSPLSRDEVFILSFAIIMLNTDLHVPSNKCRMTCAQWIKNLKVITESETHTLTFSYFFLFLQFIPRFGSLRVVTTLYFLSWNVCYVIHMSSLQSSNVVWFLF